MSEPQGPGPHSEPQPQQPAQPESQQPAHQEGSQPAPWSAEQQTEPTQPYAWQQPSAQYPTAQYPAAQYPAGPEREAGRQISGWVWPAVCALSLVVGLGGGAIGGYLATEGSDGSGGVLEVERRTAPPLEADNASVAAVAAKVLPSTVQIVAALDGRARGATGSGFVFDTEGHVITNNHVVAGAAEDDGPIQVVDQDGVQHKATVVGRSMVYDIAVLRVDGLEKLTPAAIGSSEQMRVGETVVAFGSPLGLSATVTSGIISAVNRPVTTGDGDDSSFINAVQTDAAINPGNSGGPLVNLQGQVIGVNSAIASLGSLTASDEGGNIGVGFAIPIEQVQVTTDQILKTGKAQYPVIGANVRGTESADGATVENITAGSPAEDSELEVGDVILAVDGKPVTGSIDLVVAIRTHQPGEKVTLTIRRDGKEQDIEVGLDAKTG